MPSRNLRLAWLLAATIWLGAWVVRADPESLSGSYSPYEAAAIRQAELELGGRLDPAPEGKLIERVDLVRLEPIDQRDPAPVELNVLHVTTRPSIIRRELLLSAGQPYSKVLADESARNLRRLPQLSLVVCVAMMGSASDRVRLVVITKDIWSLILDFDVSGGGKDGLNYLLLKPVESNFLGTHQVVYGRYLLERDVSRFGLGYRIPKLDGHGPTLIVDGSLILNDGESEGSSGALQVMKRPVSDRSPWAWFSAVDWLDEVTRTYVGADLDYAWRTERERGILALTRSFGWRYKNDFTVALQGVVERYALDTQATPLGRQAYAASVIPPNDKRLGPVLEWHGYTSNFLRTYEVETLGLQEDFRLGHDLVARLSPVARAFGACRDFLGVYLAAQHTLPMSNGFVRAALESATDAKLGSSSQSGSACTPPEPGGRKLAGLDLYEGNLAGRLRSVTPRLGFGRLVHDAAFNYRYQNFRNQRLFFGGSLRLRGYGENVIDGQNALVSNLEYRSPSLEFTSLQLGGVLFNDIAFAGDEPADEGARASLSELVQAMDFRSSVGFGLRLVIPSVERVGFRLDFAFPLVPEPGEMGVQFAFGQAFDLGEVRNLKPPPLE